MKVKIGVTEYDLKLISDKEMKASFSDANDSDAENTFVGGLISLAQNTIRINKDLPLQTRIQSFFHECVHAMLDEIGESELFQDEDFVDAFSKQIYGLFTANKLDKVLLFLEDKKGGRN
jgi:Zn-dependent peptidase ImmA (M78 family)